MATGMKAGARVRVRGPARVGLPARPGAGLARPRVQTRVSAPRRPQQEEGESVTTKDGGLATAEATTAVPPEPLATIPTPWPTWPIVGHLPQIRFDLFHLPERFNALYEALDTEVMALTIKDSTVIRTRNHEDVNKAFKSEEFGKLTFSRNQSGKEGATMGVLGEFFGVGLATVDDGKDQKRARQVMNPAFKKLTVDDMIKDFMTVARDMVDSIDAHAAQNVDEGLVDLQKLASAAALDSIGQLHFNFDLAQLKLITQQLTRGDVEEGVPAARSKNIAQIMKDIMGDGQKMILFPVDFARRLPWYTSYRANMQKLDEIIFDVVDQRRAAMREAGGRPGGSKDVLSAMLAAQAEPEGQWLTDSVIRDQMTTLFFAGSDTTASTVAWASYELAKNPDKLAVLQQELDSVVAEECGGDVFKLTAASLDKCSFLKGVVMETLRLYPPAPIVARDAMTDTTLGGFEIPKGTVVGLDIWSLHRNPRLWHDPLAFHPARWDASRCEEDYKVEHPDALVPFAAGMRACLGRYFALREAQVFLAVLASRYDFAPPPAGREPDLATTITILSLNGVNLRLSPRQQVSR